MSNYADTQKFTKANPYCMNPSLSSIEWMSDNFVYIVETIDTEVILYIVNCDLAMQEQLFYI